MPHVLSFDSSIEWQDLLPTSAARTIVATTLIATTAFLAMRAARPTRMMPALELRLRQVEELFHDTVALGPFNADALENADADLALELIDLQDRARTLRMQTLRRSTCSMAWWRDLCATFTGQSLAIWRCSRDVSRTRDTLKGVLIPRQLRIAERGEIFHSGFAGGYSPIVRLAMCSAVEVPWGYLNRHGIRLVTWTEKRVLRACARDRRGGKVINAQRRHERLQIQRCGDPGATFGEGVEIGGEVREGCERTDGRRAARMGCQSKPQDARWTGEMRRRGGKGGAARRNLQEQGSGELWSN
ncbi:hypothetical protein DFH09DRAFT_1105611 [Mycena vulgaris]|nr:hypothetical protein DFH09DRAFT_1105611 [Mycena vulgaris]